VIISLRATLSVVL